MANRYSRTGFTGRQLDTLDIVRRKILTIVNQRVGKQDSFKALDFLERAERLIKMAQLEAAEWVEDSN